MKKNIYYLLAIVVSCICAAFANADISNSYQYTLYTDVEATAKTEILSNDPVILNPEIDAIDVSDPRIKSVIDYARSSGNGVSIIFFNRDNLRYVKKLKQMFRANHVVTDPPQLGRPQNLLDSNLVQIYIIKDKNHVNESNESSVSTIPKHK